MTSAKLKTKLGRRPSAALLAAVASVAVLLATPAPASSAGASLTVTNVRATCGAGYSFTISGSGFTPNMAIALFINDNVFTGPLPANSQPVIVTADATHSFSVDFAANVPGQTLPATVTATDLSFSPLAPAVTVPFTTCTPTSPDLHVTKVLNGPQTVTVGSQVSYTVTVRNNGVADAHGVTLIDTPVGGTVSSMSTSQGTCTATACALGTISPGSQVSIAVVLNAATTGTLTNTATATEAESDMNPSDNVGVAPPVTVNAPPADLAVTKTTTQTMVTVGDTITYQVTVTNQGGSDAHNVQLTDALLGPATVTSMSCGTPPTCSLGTVAAGQTVPVTVVVTTNGAGPVDNAASATTTDVDSNTANNTGSAPTVTVNPATGCTTAGEVEGDGHWKLVDARGKKHDVHVQVEGQCALDKKTNMIVLRHAHVQIDWDSLGSCDAKTDSKHNDVATITITGSDAVVAGTCAGQPFRVDLHDGGKNHASDLMHAQWGARDTSTLTPDHFTVHIEND